jgi:hypothetical protein
VEKSGGERAAVQTLRAVRKCLAVAKRLDCGGFSTAFPWAEDQFEHFEKPEPGRGLQSASASRRKRTLKRAEARAPQIRNRDNSLIKIRRSAFIGPC